MKRYTIGQAFSFFKLAKKRLDGELMDRTVATRVAQWSDDKAFKEFTTGLKNGR